MERQIRGTKDLFKILGCDRLREGQDPERRLRMRDEFLPLPPITVILNLMLLFPNIESWWWMVRLGMENSCPSLRSTTCPVCDQAWDDWARKGSIIICEASNCVVHAHPCWVLHVERQTRDQWVRGFRKIGERLIEIKEAFWQNQDRRAIRFAFATDAGPLAPGAIKD